MFGCIITLGRHIAVKMKISIVSTMNSNGHTYYIFQKSGDPCHCAQNTYSPFLDSLRPMRIDSISGNIMLIGNSCQWQLNEFLLDSLRTRIGDSLHNFCNPNSCSDTNQMNIFGQIRKTKYIRLKYNDLRQVQKICPGNRIGILFTRVVHMDIHVIIHLQEASLMVCCLETQAILSASNQINTEIPKIIFTFPKTTLIRLIRVL